MGKIHSKNLLPATWKFCMETFQSQQNFWSMKYLIGDMTWNLSKDNVCQSHILNFLGRTSEKEVTPCTIFDKQNLAMLFNWSEVRREKFLVEYFRQGPFGDCNLQFANAPITKLAAVNIDWWPSQRAMCKFCQLMLISQRPICKWWEWCKWCATFAKYVQLCTIRLCTNSSAVWLSHRVLCKLYPTLC